MKLFTRIMVCALALGILTASLAGCKKAEEKDGKTATTEPAKK